VISFFCVFFLSIILSHFLLFLKSSEEFFTTAAYIKSTASSATVFTDFQPVKLSYSVKCLRKTLSFYALFLWLLIYGLESHKQVLLTGGIGLQRKKKMNYHFFIPKIRFS